jgi:lipopolysaccharide/colanic/teichoic acid biosynthesis glycosyltransferase
MMPLRPYALMLALKRSFDVVASVSGLILLFPVLAAIAAAIKLDSPGSVFFQQERVGRQGRHFNIFKFRTMVSAAPRLGTALTLHADPRVTRVGAFLRRTKLDELPQLINVVKGDMSLVGPRPEVPELMRFYSPEQRATILSVRPGITDYASIHFRNESSLLDGCVDPIEIYRKEIMPIKYQYYLRYTQDVGILTDISIIAATISLLFFNPVPKS